MNLILLFTHRSIPNLILIELDPEDVENVTNILRIDLVICMSYINY